MTSYLLRSPSKYHDKVMKEKKQKECKELKEHRQVVQDEIKKVRKEKKRKIQLKKNSSNATPKTTVVNVPQTTRMNHDEEIVAVYADGTERILGVGTHVIGEGGIKIFSDGSTSMWWW